MKNETLPPPGGIVIVVVPIISDFKIQEMQILYGEFVWLEWRDLERFNFKTDILALPKGCAAVVYSGMFEADRQDKVCRLLKQSGVCGVWFERKLEQVLVTAYRLYYGADKEHVRRQIKPSGKVRQEPDLPLPAEVKTLIAGFNPKDFSVSANSSQSFRWWTIQEAEGNSSIVREIREHKVRFIIFNRALPEFHRARHKEAARRYISSESMVEACGNEQVWDWILEIIQQEGDVMGPEQVTTIRAAREAENNELLRRYLIVIQENAELKRENQTLRAKILGLEQLLTELDNS